MKSSEAMILAVTNTIFSNCVEKHGKFRTLTGFEPVTSLKPVEVLNCSGFSTQVLKIVFTTARFTASLT